MKKQLAYSLCLLIITTSTAMAADITQGKTKAAVCASVRVVYIKYYCCLVSSLSLRERVGVRGIVSLTWKKGNAAYVAP